MSKWTKAYDTIESGDELEFKGVKGTFTIHNVKHIPGGGQGMGEFPPNWLFTLTTGEVFRYDPWFPGDLYRSFRVVAKTPPETLDKPKQFEHHRSDEYLAKLQRELNRSQEADKTRRRDEELRNEALSNMTPEQRVAFGKKAGFMTSDSNVFVGPNAGKRIKSIH